MFLPYGAVDGRLVLCFESSDRDGPMVDSRISVKYIYTTNSINMPIKIQRTPPILVPNSAFFESLFFSHSG